MIAQEAFSWRAVVWTAARSGPAPARSRPVSPYGPPESVRAAPRRAPLPAGTGRAFRSEPGEGVRRGRGGQDASRRRAVMCRAVTHRSADRHPPVARPATVRCTRGADKTPTTCAYRARTACRGVPVAAGAPTCGTPSAGRPRHHRPPRGGERRALIRRCGRRPPTARLPPARSPPYGLSRTVRPAAPPGRSSAVRPDAPANWRSPSGYRPSGTPGTSARVKDQPSRTDGQPRRCPKEFATALTGFPLTPTESLRTRR